MIWNNLCYGILQGCTCYALITLFGEKDIKYRISSLISGLIVFILSLFIHPIISILIAHFLFVIINKSMNLSFYVSLISILLTLSLECICISIYHINQIYPFSWEYTFYFLVCLYLCVFFYIQNTKNIEKEWLHQIYCFEKKEAFIILSMTIVGILLNGMIAIALNQSYLIAYFIGLLFMIVVFIVNLVLMTLMVYIHRFKQLEEEMNKWQKESRDYINVIRSQRHDFNFHVHAIVGLIENGEYDECRKYVKNVANEASQVNDIMPVHDAVIGSMLYNMRETARQKGSNITYDITYDMEHVVCNSFEINKILGNLIQNALDAMNSEQAIQAGIKVKIFKRRGNTVISVSNLFLGDKNSILKAFELGFSTKLKHEGIGLSMISKTVEKYGGRIYTEFDDNWVSFIVNIPNYVHFEEVNHEY